MSNQKTAYVDLSSDQSKNEKTLEDARRKLREQFEERLPEAVERIWELPRIIVPVGDYLELLKEARELFVSGYFYSCVAMCGIVGERLVKDVFRASVLIQSEGCAPTSPSNSAFDQFERVNVSEIVKFLKEAGLLEGAAKGAAVDLIDLRNQYAHARGKKPHEDAIRAIKKLHTLVEGTVSMVDFVIQDGGFARKPRTQADLKERDSK